MNSGETPIRITRDNIELNQKLVSIHSNDRDQNKWPESSEFEVMLPQKISNIHSMRLTSITLPNNQYVFSKEFRNTKLAFTLPNITQTTADFRIYPNGVTGVQGTAGDGAVSLGTTIDKGGIFNPRNATSGTGPSFLSPYTIEIDEGYYEAEQLALTIQNKLNEAVSVVTKKFTTGGWHNTAIDMTATHPSAPADWNPPPFKNIAYYVSADANVDASHSSPGSGEWYANNTTYGTMDDFIAAIQGGLQKLDPSGVKYNYFKCKYNEITHKIWIANMLNQFELVFNYEQMYPPENNFPLLYLGLSKSSIETQLSHWGLGAYLGFDKNTAKSINLSDNPNASSISFDYDINEQNWLVGFTESSWVDASGRTVIIKNAVGDQQPHYIEPPYTIDIMGDDVIYMEIDGLNTIDEIVPDSRRTTDLYNNDYRTRVNSAFAKIPLTSTPFGTVMNHTYGYLRNWVILKQSQKSVDSISKLKFKFRYHDGRLVNFKRDNLTFTLEFNIYSDAQIAELRRKKEAEYAFVMNKTRY